MHQRVNVLSVLVILSVCVSVYGVLVTLCSTRTRAESAHQYLAIGLVKFAKILLFLSYNVICLAHLDGSSGPYDYS